MGAGGFGITYRATRLSGNTPVALKECCPAGIVRRDGNVLMARPGKQQPFDEAKRGFQHEAELLFKMDPHPGVVRVTDHFGKHGTYFFAMDYIDGRGRGPIFTPCRRPSTCWRVLSRSRR